jgi:phosphate transport system permease protein
MSTDAPPRPAAPMEHRSLAEQTPGSRRRRIRSNVMAVVLGLAVVAAITPLLLILWQVAVNGGAAVTWQFFTDVESSPRESGGYVHGIVGTLYMTGIAAGLSIPVGILAAIYLVEYGQGRRFATVVRFFTDVMTGVPSIFVGLAIYALLVVSGGAGLGFGTFVGAAALATIMLPIVVRSTEEMLSLVPVDMRNASAGLGARQWQTTLRVVLPAAAPGITTGCVLAVARGAGETAPLVLTAFGARQIVTAFQGTPQADIGLLMKDGFSQPFAEGIERAWAGGLTLIAITLALTIGARLIASRSQL